MRTISDPRLLAKLVLALPLVLAPVGARAADDATPSKAAPAATAPTTGRSKEDILTDLNKAGDELRQIIGPKGPAALADDKTRKEIAPKAIPVMKRYLAAFDELTAQEPRAKEQAASVHGQILSMMTALGDADAEKQLKTMADGKGEEAVQAKTALLVAEWWKQSGSEAGQKKVLDGATALLKENPTNDGIAASILEMSNVGAASPAMRDAAEQVVVDNAKGEQAKMMIEEIQSSHKLKQLENKPLAIAGKLHDGKQFTTADWKGKVILVDFWATWCGPCRAELPRVKKAYKDYHDKGLEVLGVSCDNDGADLKKFLEENKDMAWPQLFDDKTPGWHPLAKEFGITGIPTMFLIDKKGVVRTVEARENFEELIPKMLAE